MQLTGSYNLIAKNAQYCCCQNASNSQTMRLLQLVNVVTASECSHPSPHMKLTMGHIVVSPE